MFWIGMMGALATEVATTPAHLAGLSSWEERLEFLRGAESSADDPAPWTRARTVVSLLAERHPEASAAIVRELTRAAMEGEESIAYEALKASFLGQPLPVHAEDSTWMARLPSPANPGATINFEVSASPSPWCAATRTAVERLSQQAGWRLDSDVTPAHIEVETPFFSSWNGSLGRGIRGRMTLPDGEVITAEGFGSGPSSESSDAELVSTLAGNLLGSRSLNTSIPWKNPEDQTPVLPQQPAAQVCATRLADSTKIPLSIQLGENFVWILEPGTWQCLDLAEGTVVSAREGSFEVVSNAPTWVQLRHGNGPGWSVLTRIDAEKVAKWKARERVVEGIVPPIPSGE